MESAVPAADGQESPRHSKITSGASYEKFRHVPAAF
jgi:hypothetical protein